MALIVTILTLTLLALSLSVSDGKIRVGKDVIYYLTIYIFIVPIWLAKATYSTFLGNKITWR